MPSITADCLYPIPTGLTTGKVVARMYYSNFAAHITLPHGVVIDSWPLDKFCCPSDIPTMNEVTVLYNAWSSGATKFRVLSDMEYDAWLTARNATAAEAMETTEETSEELPVDQSEPAAAATSSSKSKKRKAPEIVSKAPKAKKARVPLTTDSVNAVSGPSGDALAVTGKERKPRSDKGKTRKAYRPRQPKNGPVVVAPAPSTPSV